MPTIPRPCVGFYSIPSSPPVPPTIPRRPVPPNGVIALEQPIAQRLHARHRVGQVNKKGQFSIFPPVTLGFYTEPC